MLFDDIGTSLICLTSPELRFRFLLRFLSFLGLPVDPVLSTAPCGPGLLLDSLSLLTQGNTDSLHSHPGSPRLLLSVHSMSHPGTEPQRPLTSHDLPEPGVDSVGHMTSLQGARKSPGLGKPGELFLTHVLSMVLPVLPAQQRAALSLSWMQYQKLKVLEV